MKRQSFQLIYSTLTILSIVLAAKVVTAGTCVRGQQFGTWSLAGSPYIINDLFVVVPAGSTLTIAEGVVVMLKGSGSIVVSGTLIATGVTFTGADEIFVDPDNPTNCSASESRVPGSWTSITFNDSDPGSRLENCKILFGGTPTLGSITQVGGDTNVTIFGSLIAFSANNGIWLNSGASPTILNTTIRDNAGSGVFHNSSNCEPVVSGCAIINNGSFAVRAFADNVKNYSDDFMSGNTLDAFLVVEGNNNDVTTGTWEDHGVPYHVSTGVGVLDGDTLTLEPGVEILFGSNKGFNVKGTLVADADSCRHITFTALDKTSPENYWGSIFLNSSEPGTILDYCDISFGGFQNSENILMRDVGTNVIVSNCSITNSAGAGIEVLVNSETSEPFIFNNLIADNAAEGIKVVSSAAPILRKNLIAGNLQGVRLFSSTSFIDLGTAEDAGHNAFVNNTEWALFSNASGPIFAVGNFWEDSDSATIDAVRIFDDDESSGVGPVVFTPFDNTDQSGPPQIFPCPPSCEELAIAITRPTSNPAFQSTSRFLSLAGTVEDDLGVSGIAWTNTTTGETGTATLGAPRTNFTWTATQIFLIPGNNIISVRALDQDQCTATDEIVVTFIDQPGNCWALDSFDNLAPGPIDNKNGWSTVPGRIAAEVIPNPFGTGQVLELDPGANQLIIMEKSIIAQTDSSHTLELLVLADPGDTSMAKIEVKTTGNPNWDKKFQIFFGATMRLNFGPTQPEAVNFLSPVEALRWYHVRAVINLATESVDIFLDDVLVLENIAIGPGPIETLSISGWDFPGFVLFDDIRGCESSLVTTVESAELSELPQKFLLSQNYPNPFNPSTTIRFSLPVTSEVTLIIYDLLGKKVRKLVESLYNPGTYIALWDGRDNHGQTVASGVYFVQMRAGDFVRGNKITLVK